MQASRLITVMTEKVFAVGKVNIGGCRGFYLWFLSSLDWLKFFGWWACNLFIFNIKKV
jgi:hypothetical protein